MTVTKSEYDEAKWQSLDLAQSVKVLATSLYRELKIQQEKDKEISKLIHEKEGLEKSRDAIENSHLEALRTEQTKHKDEINTVHSEHDQITQDALRQHSLQIAKLDRVVKQLKDDSEIKEDESRAQMAELRKRHQDALTKAHKHISSLKDEVLSRNRALVARDTVKQLTDGELKAQFCGLVYEVDSLARLPWTQNKSDWTDELLAKFSLPPKKLQKHILQETIWTIFHKCMFASPFRLLGEEGLKLEAQWSKTFRNSSILGKY